MLREGRATLQVRGEETKLQAQAGGAEGREGTGPLQVQACPPRRER